MTEDLISIIMPAYNAEKYLEESIKSVIAQTYSKWELIIVNDGSADGTEAIAKLFARHDNRIKVIDQPNLRLSEARNTGMAAATGQWIAFLDADDLWLPEKLALQIQAAGMYPGVGVLYTDGYTFNDASTDSRPYGTITGYYTGSEMYRWEYTGNYIPILSVLLRKDVVNVVGKQDKSFIACQDWDYWLRIAAHGATFYGIPEKLFYYRRHQTNMSNDTGLINFEKACVLLKNFNKNLLTDADVSQLKSFLKITISELVRHKRIDNALHLSKQIGVVFNLPMSRLCSFLLTSLKSYSYVLIRLMFKANGLLARSI